MSSSDTFPVKLTRKNTKRFQQSDSYKGCVFLPSKVKKAHSGTTHLNSKAKGESRTKSSEASSSGTCAESISSAVEGGQRGENHISLNRGEAHSHSPMKNQAASHIILSSAMWFERPQTISPCNKRVFVGWRHLKHTPIPCEKSWLHAHRPSAANIISPKSTSLTKYLLKHDRTFKPYITSHQWKDATRVAEKSPFPFLRLNRRSTRCITWT